MSLCSASWATVVYVNVYFVVNVCSLVAQLWHSTSKDIELTNTMASSALCLLCDILCLYLYLYIYIYIYIYIYLYMDTNMQCCVLLFPDSDLEVSVIFYWTLRFGVLLSQHRRILKGGSTSDLLFGKKTNTQTQTSGPYFLSNAHTTFASYLAAVLKEIQIYRSLCLAKLSNLNLGNFSALI